MRVTLKSGAEGLGIVWASVGLAVSTVRHDMTIINAKISVKVLLSLPMFLFAVSRR
jgi:hypothetical protein